MSCPASRRSVLRTLAAIAVLPAFARSTAAFASGLSSITPPSGPMLFARRLTRELSGGYSIVVERRFEVRFEALGCGFKVEDRQVASRVENGLFPLELDRAGLIKSDRTQVSHDALEHAVRLALAQVGTMRLTSDEKVDARAFLTGLERAAGKISSKPPADLFTPPPAAMAVTQKATLPGGLSGSISTRFSGSVSSATGLLEHAERIVSTEAAGTRRRTFEHWSLGELSGNRIF